MFYAAAFQCKVVAVEGIGAYLYGARTAFQLLVHDKIFSALKFLAAAEKNDVFTAEEHDGIFAAHCSIPAAAYIHFGYLGFCKLFRKLIYRTSAALRRGVNSAESEYRYKRACGAFLCDYLYLVSARRVRFYKDRSLVS